jgi:hypothetical protein
MPSSIISQVMVAIIIGMPIIGIIGMLAFIGICICMAFIMVKLPKRFDSWTKLMGRILGSGERRTRCRSNSNRGCRDSFSAAARAGFSASAAGWISWRTGTGQQRVFRCDGYARISASHNPKK